MSLLYHVLVIVVLALGWYASCESDSSIRDRVGLAVLYIILYILLTIAVHSGDISLNLFL